MPEPTILQHAIERLDRGRLVVAVARAINRSQLDPESRQHLIQALQAEGVDVR